MKKKMAALLTGAMLMLATTAMATPITGTVDFAGNFTTDTGLLNTATEVIFGITTLSPYVPPTGSYLPLNSAPPLTPVTYNNLTFNPSTAASPLWSILYGGTNYSFDITSVTIVTQLSNFLELSGVGTLNIDGYDPTPGSWTFSSTGGNTSTIGFVAESAVPEPGTMVLLGIGMLGLAIYGKRRMNKEA